MHRRALEVLACPECALPFTEISSSSETLEAGTLRCRYGHEFEIASGIPLLVQESDLPRVRAYANSYAPTWAKDGWGCPDPDYLMNLPYRDVTRRRAAEWRVKARSMEAVFRVLDPRTCRRVVDLGSGVGWLSHRLATRGHEVYAVDAVLDETVGLGAAGAYLQAGPPFERVWGELHRPPFRSSIVDAVVCNASLHYARDLSIALREIARILRPGGLVAILNSPVHINRASAARAESDFRAHLRNLGATEGVVSTYHHFTRSQLESDVRAAIGTVHEIRFDSGRWFRWSRRLKGLALRMELASFPILTVTKRELGLPTS